jgi:hypothetical protein
MQAWTLLNVGGLSGAFFASLIGLSAAIQKSHHGVVLTSKAPVLPGHFGWTANGNSRIIVVTCAGS